MQQMAGGRGAIYERPASVSGFAEAERRFLPDSLLVAHPIRVWGPLWAGVLGCEASPAFLTDLDRRLLEATTTHLKPIGDPGKLLAILARRGYQLGVFSNDSQMAVRAHMRKLGIEHMFCFIAGYDSGFGAKPDPGPVIAFAKAVGVSLSRTAVVGDTVLDLAAAHAAGAVAVGVLTGPATAATLSPVADIILASIDDIPTWVN
jgi:phosphoglycolate phosphatase